MYKLKPEPGNVPNFLSRDMTVGEILERLAAEAPPVGAQGPVSGMDLSDDASVLMLDQIRRETQPLFEVVDAQPPEKRMGAAQLIEILLQRMQIWVEQHPAFKTSGSPILSFSRRTQTPERSAVDLGRLLNSSVPPTVEYAVPELPFSERGRPQGRRASGSASASLPSTQGEPSGSHKENQDPRSSPGAPRRSGVHGGEGPSDDHAPRKVSPEFLA